jgi:hypothetical protein
MTTLPLGSQILTLLTLVFVFRFQPAAAHHTRKASSVRGLFHDPDRPNEHADVTPTLSHIALDFGTRGMRTHNLLGRKKHLEACVADVAPRLGRRERMIWCREVPSRCAITTSTLARPDSLQTVIKDPVNAAVIHESAVGSAKDRGLEEPAVLL